MRKIFAHDGDYALYLREERKLIQEERGRVRKLAAVEDMYFWQTLSAYLLFFLTPKCIWSQFLEIKNASR